MAKPKRKMKRKMSGKITPRTALTSSIIVMCRQPFYRRVYLAYVIFVGKHAKKGNKV